MYTIEILNNYNNDKFNQLKKLIKKFAIDVFMVQKFNLSNDSYNKKNKYIDNYTKYLFGEEFTFLKKDINERIDFAINSIKSISKDKQDFTYY